MRSERVGKFRAVAASEVRLSGDLQSDLILSIEIDYALTEIEWFSDPVRGLRMSSGHELIS